MKRRIFYFIATMILCFTLCSCKKNETGVPTIVWKDTYKTNVQMIVHGNKADSKYLMSIYCNGTDMHRIETLEPSYLKSKVIVQNKNNWQIYHPILKETIHATNLLTENELLLLGVIHNAFFEQSTTAPRFENYKELKLLCVKRENIAVNNQRANVILYLDQNGKIPMFMNILDENGKLMVELIYSEFDDETVLSKDIYNFK